MSEFRKNIDASRSISNFQIFLGICFSLYAVYKYENTRGNAHIVFIILAIWAFYSSFKRKKLVKIGNKYVSHMPKSGSYFIESLISSTKTDEKILLEEIRLLISEKYIPYGYIDSSLNTVVIPEKIITGSDKKEELEEVVCESCGGVNDVPVDGSVECEYCGSAIKN